MSPLRLIGYIGLILLSAIVVLGIYFSFVEGDWRGIAVGIGALIMFAFFGNALWMAGVKEKRPYASVALNRFIFGLFLIVLSVVSVVLVIERLLAERWLSAAVAIFMALFLIEGTYRVLRNKT